MPIQREAPIAWRIEPVHTPNMTFEVENTRRGFRLNQHGCVLSEVLSNPGATNSVFDFLAAAVAIFAPGGDAAVLGFAGGGMIAPLRAAGATARVQGVDLDSTGYHLFRQVSNDWAGPVEFIESDAAGWIRRSGLFDVVVEDLSVPTEDDVIKPPVSTNGGLPDLVRSHLRPGGVCVTNLLKPRNTSWECFTPNFIVGYRSALMVHLREFENRLLVAGDFEQGARWLSVRLRDTLERIGSDQADQFYVRSVKR